MINKYSHIHGAGIKQNHVFPVKIIKLMYSIYLKMTVKTFMSSFELCVYSNKYWKKILSSTNVVFLLVQSYQSNVVRSVNKQVKTMYNNALYMFINVITCSL